MINTFEEIYCDNSSVGEIYPNYRVVASPVKGFNVNHKSPILKKKKYKPVPYISRAILLYTPEPETVEINWP